MGFLSTLSKSNRLFGHFHRLHFVLTLDSSRTLTYSPWFPPKIFLSPSLVEALVEQVLVKIWRITNNEIYLYQVECPLQNTKKALTFVHTHDTWNTWSKREVVKPLENRGLRTKLQKGSTKLLQSQCYIDFILFLIAGCLLENIIIHSSKSHAHSKQNYQIKIASARIITIAFLFPSNCQLQMIRKHEIVPKDSCSQ